MGGSPEIGAGAFAGDAIGGTQREHPQTDRGVCLRPHASIPWILPARVGCFMAQGILLIEMPLVDFEKTQGVRKR